MAQSFIKIEYIRVRIAAVGEVTDASDFYNLSYAMLQHRVRKKDKRKKDNCLTLSASTTRKSSRVQTSTTPPS